MTVDVARRTLVASLAFLFIKTRHGRITVDLVQQGISVTFEPR